MGPRFFWWLQREDGVLENLSVVLLVFASVNFAWCGILIINKSKYKKIICYLISFILFLWAGEEISWGERIFNYSIDFISNHNAQNETTIHNLRVLQPILKYAYFLFFATISVFSFTKSAHQKSIFLKPHSKLFYYFSIPAGYYGLGIVFSFFPEISSAPLDNQELYELCFIAGIAIHSKQVCYDLKSID